MELGKFENAASMERASARFLDALLRGREPQRVENVETRLECGHDIKNAYRYAGKRHCRVCNPRIYAERRRDDRLPEMIENTREKLARLEGEARRKGLIR